MLMEEIFKDVYRNNIWGDPETVSGHGSGVARTAAFRDQFANLLIELGTRSLLDAGCGDFNWMKEVQLPIARYFGVDVVPELIAKNQTNYKAPGGLFIHGDIAHSRGHCARRSAPIRPHIVPGLPGPFFVRGCARCPAKF
jgi:SAM-dependent methyltransferase